MKLSNRLTLFLIFGLLVLLLIGSWFYRKSRSSEGEITPPATETGTGDYLSTDWENEGMVLQVTAKKLYWNPEVVQLVDGTYRMYCEYSTDNGRSWRIVVFTSPDGKGWTLVGTALKDANMPTVVRLLDNRWRLYFNDFTVGSMAGGFGSAISADGLVFKREAGLRISPKGDLEAGGIRHPTAVALPDGAKFRIYYEAQGGSKKVNRIFSASSTDGLSFTRDKGIRVDATIYDEWLSASSPSVLRTPDGKWHLYYAQGYNPESKAQKPLFGKLGISLAWSGDGLNFTLGDESEVKQGVLGDGKQYHPTDPAILIVKEDSEQILKMWYYTQTFSEQFGQNTGIFLIKKAYKSL